MIHKAFGSAHSSSESHGPNSGTVIISPKGSEVVAEKKSDSSYHITLKKSEETLHIAVVQGHSGRAL